MQCSFEQFLNSWRMLVGLGATESALISVVRRCHDVMYLWVESSVRRKYFVSYYIRSSVVLNTWAGNCVTAQKLLDSR